MTSGLKPSQFIRDNRKGFTFHTLVFASSGIPLGIDPEMVTDGCAYDASTRLLTTQLAPARRSREVVPCITNLTLFADREPINLLIF